MKRRPLATNFIGNATKTPNVTLEVIWLSTDDFRTNIDWSPNLSGSEIYARTRKNKADVKLKNERILLAFNETSVGVSLRCWN